jgi:hypothetical protein
LTNDGVPASPTVDQRRATLSSPSTDSGVTGSARIAHQFAKTMHSASSSVGKYRKRLFSALFN